MTGFGRAEVNNGARSWSVEVRSVNNRFLDVKMKLPKGYNLLEERLRSLVLDFFNRGRVDLYINVQGDFSDLVEINVNTDLAQLYKNALSEISEKCQLNGEVSAIQLSQYPEVIQRQQRPEDLESEVWPHLETAVKKALDDCTTMRQKEGEALQHDLIARIEFFSTTINEIEISVPELVLQRKSAMEERLSKILSGTDVDPQRLAAEVAVLADKTDVTEEIVRLRCHIEQLRAFIIENVSVGRKMDFLVQEFLREVNTVASKINDAKIAHLTVSLKSELEKIREQVQNIE